MTKKICVTSVHPVGCTFVDWSIHFLSGQQDFYQLSTHTWVPLSNNPLTQTNAHGHLKNHPSGQQELQKFLEKFDTLSEHRFYTAYPVPLRIDKAAQQLNIKFDDVSTEYKKLKDYVAEDYNQLFETCYQQNTKLIFVSTSTKVPFYFLNTRSLYPRLLKPNEIVDSESAIDDVQKIFFKESVDTWTNLSLTEIWDVRERRALDLRIDSNPDGPVTNFESPHLWIDSLDLWIRTDEIVHKIMDYVELEIVSQRLDQWHPICKKWQQIQSDALQFDHHCNHIVDAIINNWHYDINLTFEQEVVIQHLLIYKHNLNLKTWQLAKFPSNTKDLHKLLEPNLHSVPKIY